MTALIIDPLLYPATSALYVKLKRTTTPDVTSRGVTLAAATGRAMRIARDAMTKGDHHTARLMAEAFSRIAMCDPEPSEGSSAIRNRLGLTKVALALTHCAHRAPTPTDAGNPANGRCAYDGNLDAVMAEIDLLLGTSPEVS